eukprot:Gb_35926 [translate_table: standard]
MNAKELTKYKCVTKAGFKIARNLSTKKNKVDNSPKFCFAAVLSFYPISSKCTSNAEIIACTSEEQSVRHYSSWFSLLKRYVGSRHTSEWFNTAGRNVKTGLIASVIVSQWTWAATILQSSNVAWEYGVSGPFWYASGATIQVLLFGIMAIEIKRKAPHAHTVCEIVRARWGFAAHIVFLTFCFLTNIIVTAMLLLGGSAVVNALTGVNIYAASFLIPLGVIVYTLAGGLKATFLASYIHSVIRMNFNHCLGIDDFNIAFVLSLWSSMALRSSSCFTKFFIPSTCKGKYIY